MFADNNWHHIALVREPGNGSIHFYLDGVEGIETDNDELIENDINDATNKVFALGYHSHSNVGTGWFDGNIDDFRVSSVARYTGNFTPPSVSTSNYWHTQQQLLPHLTVRLVNLLLVTHQHGLELLESLLHELQQVTTEPRLYRIFQRH